MNKKRRKIISQCVADLDKIRNAINDVLQDEQDALSNLECFFEDTIQMQNMEECIESLENAIEYIDDAILTMEDI